MSLIQANQLKDLLVSNFQASTKVTILSAYFTVPAAKLLIQNLPIESIAKVVVRARPCDLLAGSTDIRAIRLLYENGIRCHIHRSLHAKLYVFDDEHGYVGSSNFTSNGLKISGYGNLELSTAVSIATTELEMINKISADAILVTSDILESLESYIHDSNLDLEHETIKDWWEDVLHLDKYSFKEGLFVADLPWCNLNEESNTSEAKAHDDDIFRHGELTLKNSKIYQFILQKLHSEGLNEVYFGQLTEWIHSALKDDILPYRSELKNYVANVYSYLDKYGQDCFIIDRPNYSQRIKLINHE